MKIKCEIIQDLLPLYHDKVCSEESSKLVENHLNECENCKKIASTMEIEFEVPKEPEHQKINAGFKNGFRKIKKRFALIIACILILTPVLVITARLITNQVNKEGICFTNIDEIRFVKKFLKNIKNGNYEEAFSVYDRSADYYSIVTTHEPYSPYDFYDKIDINGEIWYIDKSDEMYEYYNAGEDIFEIVLKEEINNVMIPADIFEQYEKNHNINSIYDKFKWNGNIYYMFGQWHGYEEIYEEDHDSSYLIFTSSLVPEKGMQDYVEELRIEEKEHEKYISEHFSDVLEMTLEEYEYAEGKKAGEKIERLKSEGIYIDKFKYTDAFMMDDCWCIFFNVVFHIKNGKKLENTVGFRVCDNKITICSLSGNVDRPLYEEIDAFWECF